MVLSIREKLEALANYCKITDFGEVNGWSIDRWILSEEAVDAARSVYLECIVPTLDDDLKEALSSEGINIEALLLQGTGSSDSVTRADIVELCAAASALVADGATFEGMVLPNVPKSSRKKSETGIDVICACLDFGCQTSALSVDDYLLLMSVKHSVQSSTYDVHYKAICSVSDDSLSLPYLVEQLRVLQGRLEERGFTPAQAKRVFLAIGNGTLANTTSIKIVAVVAVDCALTSTLDQELQQLLKSPSGLRRLRQITVPEIAKLHEISK